MPATRDIHQRAQRSLWLVLSRQALVALLAFASGIVLARTLSPADFGVFAIAMFVVVFVGMIALVLLWPAAAWLPTIYPKASPELVGIVRLMSADLYLLSWCRPSEAILERTLRGLARRHQFTSVPRTLVGYTRRPGSVSQSYDSMIAHGQRVLEKAQRDDPAITDADYRAFRARDMFGAACLCLVDERRDMAWRYLSLALQNGPRMILARPRRWGVMVMLTLASTLPARVYRAGALAAMSRAAFRLPAGVAFDSLA